MEARSLTKVLTSPITKLTWAQIQPMKSINCKNLHCPNMSSDTFLLKNTNTNNFLTVQKNLPKGYDNINGKGFCLATNNRFWNKLTTQDQQQIEVPEEQSTDKVEVEPVVIEGIGWAGQPIVRRKHPILPEMCGDTSDIFSETERFHNISKAHEESYIAEPTGSNKANDNVQLHKRNSEVEEISPIEHPQNKVLTHESKDMSPTENSEQVSSMVKSGLNQNFSQAADKIKMNPPTAKGSGGVKRNAEGKVITAVKLFSKTDEKSKQMYSCSLTDLTKQKKKTKKKTKVSLSSSKNNVLLSTKTKAKKSTKKKGKKFGISKKSSIQPNYLLSQPQSRQTVGKNVMLLENRQLQTYSHANQAKMTVKVNVKETKSAVMISLAKKKIKNSKLSSEGKYPDDCKCPETTEIKNRYPTKICGEAVGATDKKKIKEWKGKMCPIEHQVKQRRRTFVCSSAKFAKNKRKRQLPKCVKPEKKVASRVKVCPPVLEDELEKKSKKKCVKQVEEVKIRARTKVCKPVVFYAKAEAVVEVQKAVCVEKKVQKTISKHTKVCSPSEKNGMKNIKH